jgi:transcriptional regulator with XRE-family HTH domain
MKIMSAINTLGQILRELRETRGLLLRQVAAALEIDTALLSKFERDERTPNKDQVISFARYYNANTDELLLAWLSDKIAGDVQHEDLAIEALKAAEKKLGLLKKKKENK